MATPIRFKRGSRAQIMAAAASNGLAAGEPYLITDEDNFALATSASTFQTFVRVEGIRAVVRLTQAAYDALSPPDPDTLYVVTG